MNDLPTGPEFEHRLEALEQAFYRDMTAACPQPLAAEMRISAEDRDGLLVLALGGWDHPMFNRTVGFGITSPGSTELLDDCARRFADLGFAGTLPAARRRGAQTAMVARRIRDACDAGCRWVISETDEQLPDKPNPSYRNLVRWGMPVVYVRANWGPPKP